MSGRRLVAATVLMTMALLVGCGGTSSVNTAPNEKQKEKDFRPDRDDSGGRGGKKSK